MTTTRVQAPLRPAARILTGSTYVLLGFDALREPGGRVDQAADVLATIRRWVPLPADDERVVQGNAAVQGAAGGVLGRGRCPAPDALALPAPLASTPRA